MTQGVVFGDDGLHLAFICRLENLVERAVFHHDATPRADRGPRHAGGLRSDHPAGHVARPVDRSPDPFGGERRRNASGE